MTETLQKREGLEIYRKMTQRDAHISIFSNESCEIDIYIYIYSYIYTEYSIYKMK